MCTPIPYWCITMLNLHSIVVTTLPYFPNILTKKIDRCSFVRGHHFDFRFPIFQTTKKREKGKIASNNCMRHVVILSFHRSLSGPHLHGITDNVGMWPWRRRHLFVLQTMCNNFRNASLRSGKVRIYTTTAQQSKNSNYPVMCLMFFLMFTVPGIRFFKLKVFVGCWGHSHSHKSQSQARNIIQKLPGSR